MEKKQLQCCCVYQSVFGWRFGAGFQLCHSFTLRVTKCRRRADANDTTWHASSENRKLKDWKTKSEQADSLMRRAVPVPDCHYCQNAMQVAWLQTNWPQTAWAVHGWPSLHLISLRHLIYSDTRKKKKNEYMTCESQWAVSWHVRDGGKQTAAILWGVPLAVEQLFWAVSVCAAIMCLLIALPSCDPECTCCRVEVKVKLEGLWRCWGLTYSSPAHILHNSAVPSSRLAARQPACTCLQSCCCHHAFSPEQHN